MAPATRDSLSVGTQFASSCPPRELHSRTGFHRVSVGFRSVPLAVGLDIHRLAVEALMLAVAPNASRRLTSGIPRPLVARDASRGECPSLNFSHALGLGLFAARGAPCGFVNHLLSLSLSAADAPLPLKRAGHEYRNA